MDNLDRINLQKMISANDVQDCTEEIRNKKHSDHIRQDVNRLLELKKIYSIDSPELDEAAVFQCNFLFNNYTDIFNKVKKEEMNLAILDQLLTVLKQIEDGALDQHSGAHEVGKLLKKIYIDGALMKAEKRDKITGEVLPANVNEPKAISWKQFKFSNKI